MKKIIVGSIMLIMTGNIFSVSAPVQAPAVEAQAAAQEKEVLLRNFDMWEEQIKATPLYLAHEDARCQNVVTRTLYSDMQHLYPAIIPMFQAHDDKYEANYNTLKLLIESFIQNPLVKHYNKDDGFSPDLLELVRNFRTTIDRAIHFNPED